MARPNATAYSVLGFLHDGPKSGWDVAEQAASTIGYFWNVTRSQVYRELRTLEEAGFVRGGERGQRDRRVYTLTDEGREAFAEWISREPGPEIFRFPMLLTLWFGEHLRENELGWFLSLHRSRHEKLLKTWEKLAASLPEEELDSPRGYTLRFALAYGEAIKGWYDELPWFREPRGRGKGKSRSSGKK